MQGFGDSSSPGCRSQRSLTAVLALTFTLAFFAIPGVAQQYGANYVGPPVSPHSFSGDLRKLPPAKPLNLPPVPRRIRPDFTAVPPLPFGPPDPLWQKGALPEGRTPSKTQTPGVTPPQFTNPVPNFDTSQPGDGPPDDNGAVGPNHYIAIVNFTFQIFDKSGNSLAGPTNPATLWASAPAGDACQNQRGDPYVLYDHLADRWIITYFANDPTLSKTVTDPLEWQCIAVSKGPNPVTSGFFVYSFFLGISNDYPKLAIWPDGYYLISQEGYDGTSSLDAWVFDRANMLNGNPATFQHPSGFPSEHDVITLPSDLTGPPPPVGSPNFYARPYDGNLYSDGSPRLEIFEFHTDWGVPANTTFSLVQTLTPATFRSDICSGGALDQFCVPQPGTTATLDALSIWPMGPLQYRNFGDHESLVFNHAVNVDGAGLVGIRWYELRRTPPGAGSWVIQQQGTFAPADSTTTTTTSIHRWTGSIGMDQAGNLALGYNVSNDGVSPHPTVFPGVRIVGRLATDPLGEMTTPEVHLADGGAVNGSSGGQRWGDYSALRVDPADGCTFWYTTEYVPAGGQQTHVGAVRFPTCNPADMAITKSGPSTATAGGTITYTITVTNNGPSTATNVVVTDNLPPAVQFLNSSDFRCSASFSQVTCNFGTMANGASITVTIQAQVSANLLSNLGTTSTTITNVASVTATQLDPDTTNNQASVNTTVNESADLQVIKTCKPDTTTAVAGSSAVCSIQVNNLGPSDAQNAVLTDSIIGSTPFTVISAVSSVGACSPSAVPSPTTNVVISCPLGTVAAANGATITVTFTAQDGGNVDDTATVAATTPDPNNSNNTASGAVTFVSSADLAITKSVSPNPVIAGTNLTYTITVSNAGPSTATGVVVTDTLPAQISVLSVTPSSGTCTAGIPGNPLQPLTCTMGNVAKSGTATVVVVAAVASNVPSGTVVNNNASVSSAVADPNNANNSATAADTVLTSADLSVVKLSDKLIYKPSSTVIYQITVTNSGPSDALAVAVTDNLPALTQAIYKSDTGACIKNASTPTQLVCNLGYMAVGSTRNFTITERVNGSRGNITNTAIVNSTSSPPTPDPNTANNTSVRVVTIGK